MPRFWFLFSALALISACVVPDSDQHIVQLVPAESLATVFPAAIDSFEAVSDTVYRGFRAVETDTLALITAARIYSTQRGEQLAINLSSFDKRDLFLAVYGDGARRDSSTSMETYDVLFGRIVLPDNHHAAEAKSFNANANRAALEHIDYNRLSSLATAPTVVDSTFQVRFD